MVLVEEDGEQALAHVPVALTRHPVLLYERGVSFLRTALSPRVRRRHGENSSWLSTRFLVGAIFADESPECVLGDLSL